MKKQLVMFIGIMLLFTGCLTSSTSGGAVGADRSQLMLVSSAQMNTQAEKGYAETIAKAKANHTLNVDKKQYMRVKAIADKLIPQTKIFRKDAPSWKWEVNVIKSDTLNAWCMPGGKIAFYSGIIEKLNLTDGEIAAIMGHEISHALKEHSRENASRDYLKKAGLSIASLAGVSDSTLGLVNMATTYAIQLPFGRSQESEADKMGVELAARAGYNPNEAINVWKKMEKYAGSGPLEILSTHPSHETRIEDLQKISKKVYPLYLQAKK